MIPFPGTAPDGAVGGEPAHEGRRTRSFPREGGRLAREVPIRLRLEYRYFDQLLEEQDVSQMAFQRVIVAQRAVVHDCHAM